MMKIPLYKQEFSWSCLTTCIKMVLEYYGVKKTEKELRILFKTTPVFGTMWEFVESEVKRMGFKLVWKKFWNIQELESLIKQSIPLIAGIKREGEIHGHGVVVINISDNRVIAADPQIGDLIILYKEEFLELWTERDNIAGYLTKV